MKRTAVLLSLAIMSLTTGYGQETTAKKVAMLQPISKGGALTNMQKSIIRGSLTKAIASSGDYEAFSRADIDAITNEQKFQQSGMVSDDQRTRMGALSGATLICLIALTVDEDNFYVEASLIDVKTGKIVKSADQLMPNKPNTEIQKGCQQLATQLLQGSSSPQTYTATKQSTTTTATTGMVLVQGGTFMMGCTSDQNGCDDNESPAHQVTVNSFKMGKTEVTFDEYDAFCDATGRTKPSDSGWGRGTRPVINVTWNDAMAYCDWMAGKTGEDYRLPTEAEWEYACRAGTTTTYNMGNDLRAANFGGINYKTLPVGSYRANAWGLFDMHGNVWEWCSDWYGSDYYTQRAGNNPTGPRSGTSRVIRGGSWDDSAEYCRSAHHNGAAPSDSFSGLGFRVVVPQ